MHPSTRNRAYSDAKPQNLVTKLLASNSQAVMLTPPSNDFKRSSLQADFVSFFKKLESDQTLKPEDENMITVFEGLVRKGDRQAESHSKRLSVQNQRNTYKKSLVSVSKEATSKNLDTASSELSKRGSITGITIAESLEISALGNKETPNAYGSSRLSPKVETPNIKKHLMDSNYLSASRFQLSKQKSVMFKELSGAHSPDGLFDSMGDSFRADGRVLMSSTMRRRSCHCSDCGGLSCLEKKHLNIVIPCPRVQNRGGISLSLKYSDVNSNANSPLQSTPRRRVNEGKEGGNGYLTVAPQSPTSKKFLTVINNSDKDKTSNLSRFAGVAKRSFTTQVEESQQILPTRSAIENNRSQAENITDDDVHQSFTVESEQSVKTPVMGQKQEKQEESESATPIMKMATLERFNSLDNEKEKRPFVISRKKSLGDFNLRTENSSPANITSPKLGNSQFVKPFKPPALLNVLSSRKFLIKSQLSSTHSQETEKEEELEQLGRDFSKKVAKAIKKPKNHLKLRNLSILETYTHSLKSPASAGCKTPAKNIMLESIETSNSALLKPSIFSPKIPMKGQLVNSASQKRLDSEPKSAFYMRSSTQASGFLPRLGDRETEKDAKSHRGEIFKGGFELEASENVISRLKKRRGLSTDNKERVQEVEENENLDGVKTKKKVVKAKHRKNKSNPLILQDIKKAYQMVKSPAIINKGRDVD